MVWTIERYHSIAANLDVEDDHPHETHQIYPTGKDGYSHGVAKDEHQHSRDVLQASGLPTHVCPVDGPDQLWAIDITYMPSIRDGNCYCFNVVDVFTRVQDTPRNRQNRDKGVPVYHTKRQKGDRQLQEAMILMDTRIIADRLTAEKDIRIHQYAPNTQKRDTKTTKGAHMHR